MFNDSDHEIWQGVKIVSKSLRFEELYGKKDLGYWAKYLKNHGSSHLVNKSHNLHPFFLYDYDILLFLVIVIFIFFKILTMLFRNCYASITKSKQ